MSEENLSFLFIVENKGFFESLMHWADSGR